MFTFYVTVVSFIIGIIIIISIYQKITNAVCQSKKRLDGRTVIVTGGTAGMGLEMACDFARRRARVIVACPFNDEGARAKEQIIQQSRNENVVFKYLDLGSLESVRAFATDILKTENRLDILINNAGLASSNDFITKDGMDFIMQVNFFGAFQLTLLLLPLLRKSGRLSEPSRIVNTSSIAHWLGRVDIDSINKTGYRWFPSLHTLMAYSNSKLYHVLFTHEMAKKLKNFNVVVNSVDPGGVGTNIFLTWNKTLGRLFSLIAYYVLKTPWQGAQTALHVALDKGAGEVSGQLFKNCKLIEARALGYDDTLAAKLWDESVKLVKLSKMDIDLCFK